MTNRNFYTLPLRAGMKLGSMWVCLKMSCTPVYPMCSLLNGYFIGNIPYFQTNPCVTALVTSMSSLHGDATHTKNAKQNISRSNATNKGHTQGMMNRVFVGSDLTQVFWVGQQKPSRFKGCFMCVIPAISCCTSLPKRTAKRLDSIKSLETMFGPQVLPSGWLLTMGGHWTPPSETLTAKTEPWQSWMRWWGWFVPFVSI